MSSLQLMIDSAPFYMGKFTPSCLHSHVGSVRDLSITVLLKVVCGRSWLRERKTLPASFFL
jgi:hypothetical protein